MLRLIIQLSAIGLVAVWFAGCASFVELKGRDYPESASLNYQEGLRFMADENYEIAEKYFGLVKTKYAYSMYAPMSELLIADTYYRRDMFPEAIDNYRRFRRRHPTHPCNPYAQFRTGDAFLEQLPEDWWFMPPVYERDQVLTEKAVREYNRLIRMERAEDYYYPKTYRPETIGICEGRHYGQVRSMIYLSKKRTAETLRRLIDREVYAARYNLKNDSPRGAVWRLEGAFSKYPDTVRDRELVEMLAESYTEAHMYKRARAVWRWLAVVHPKHEKTAELDATLRAIDEHERDWKAEQAEKKEKNAPIEAERDRLRSELGLQKVDPDPDPDADAVIPLPDPSKL